MASPTGTVTFLFTDIEGSTELWQRDPEAMADALTAHDELIRSVVTRHGGVVFKHTGDGMCVVFGVGAGCGSRGDRVAVEFERARAHGSSFGRRRIA